MSFFILGLPRSRTAWLANFMTYNGFFCYHEGTNGCKSIEEYKRKMDYSFVGDANTGLILFNPRKYFPNSRIVIIDSSITKSVEFGKEQYGVDYTEQMLLMKEKLDALDGLHIPLGSLNTELKTIWDYLTDCVPYNSSRADELTRLDIQAKLPYQFDIEAAKSFKESVNEDSL